MTSIIDTTETFPRITIDPNRDFEANPLTVNEAISLFLEEQFELAVASCRTVELACDKMQELGLDNALDIMARWDDYQEELRIMAAEFV